MSKPKFGEREIVKYAKSGVFAIMTDGDIWRLSRHYQGQWLKIKNPRRIKKVVKGYIQVRLQIEGDTLCCAGHRLVWQYFNGDIPEGMEINHKNFNKIDNSLGNLEVVTPKQNMSHALANLKWNYPDRKGENSNVAKVTDNDILAICKMYKTGNYTYAQLAKLFGIRTSSVGNYVNNKSWKHLVR